MLNDIKLLLNIKDNSRDDVLNYLIENCKEEYKSITHKVEVEDGVIVQMVVFKFSQLGAQGLEGESLNGVSFTYAQDYPEFIKRQIFSKRKVVTL